MVLTIIVKFCWLKEKQRESREKFRAKGKESAVRRGRKTNKNTIKEYAGWEEF